MNDIKKVWDDCVRILKVTRKPTPLEFRRVVKVTGLSMVLTGLIGFIIHVIFSVL